MNASITLLAGSVLGWLADYYLLATLLLLIPLACWRWVRQPAHRILIAWTVMLELAMLAVVCALPFWPRVSFIAAAPREAAPVVAAESVTVHEEPVMAKLPMPLPSVGRVDRKIAGDSVSAKPSMPEAARSAAPPAISAAPAKN